MKNRKLFISLLLTGWCYLAGIFSAKAQSVCRIEHYAVNDGLSQSFVQRICQSPDGLLWFGTWNGLNGYDGYTFFHYNMLSPGGEALTTNRITYIHMGTEGDIWCQTYDGRVFLFDMSSRTFIDVLAPMEQENNAVYSVQQIIALPKGTVWILCNGGETFRIDEQRFKQQREVIPYRSTAPHLQGCRVTSVHQESNGDEWILTDKGIDLIGRKQLTDHSIYKAFWECNGSVYLSRATGGVAVYRPNSGRIEPLATSSIQEPVTAIEAWGSDTLLIQTPHALWIYNHRQQTTHAIEIRQQARSSSRTGNLYIDDNRRCWLTLDKNEVLCFDGNSGEIRCYALPTPLPPNKRIGRELLFADKGGTLWVIPSQGAMCYYDTAHDAFLPYLQDKTDPSSVYMPYIRFYTFDRQGNLWFSSNTGLEKVTFLPNFFTLEQLEPEMDIRSFLKEKNGRIWAGSQSGIVRIYTPGDSQPRYLSPQGGLMREKCIFSSGVYTLLQDSEGVIWAGTKENGLYALRPKGNERFEVTNYMHQPTDPYSLNSNNIYALHQDSRQRLWIGSFGGGLHLLTHGRHGEARFLHAGNELHNYPLERTARVRCLAETAEGVLLIGSTDGLLVCDLSFDSPEEATFIHQTHRAGDASSLSSNDIMGLYTDKEETVYILGFTGGINTISADSLLTAHALFKRYTTKEGLISTLVHTLTQDHEGRLWVAAENGLSCFDRRNDHFINYPSDMFRRGLKFAETIPLITDGQLLFGTNIGILSLSLEKLPRNEYIPTVLLTEVRVQGEPLTADMNHTPCLTLPPEKRNLSFRFSAIDFNNNENLQYAYRLQGLEKEWNEVGNTRMAGYINLPPGDYTFEVKSTNGNGIWMENTRTLRIVLEPRFTETVWAWVLYAVLLLILVSAVCYVLFYIYRLRHRIDWEQQLADAKLRFFTDISHELRTPLTLITSPVDEVLHNEPLSQKARENLTLVETNTRRMLRMVNQILDFRKLQNNKMKMLVEEIDLLSLLRQVMSHFDAIARKKRIAFELQTSTPSLPIWLDRDKAEKIFFNLLSNAFKYTPEGKAITIEVQHNETNVQVAVADQGIGIDESAQKKLFQRFESFATGDKQHLSSGIGLSLVKELVELHHGHIEVVSKKNEGSRFTVTLPLDRAVYEQDKQTEFIINEPSAETVTSKEHQQPIETTEPDAQKECERVTLLVVEDNDELRRFLHNLLADNYHLLEATHGKEGLILAQQQVPDLILTDVMMPVMDGLEMVRQLKSDRTTCHIPILVLSAKASIDDRITGLEQEIDDYIGKPFHSAYLKARITSLIRQRQRLQQIYMERLSAQPTPDSYEPTRPKLVPLDEQFMTQVMTFIEKNIDNQALEIEELAENLHMSRTAFYRKLKSITGLTPVEFVREFRLKRAVQLMQSDDFTIAQVAYMTGFSDPKYFSKCFKKQTGLTPSEYKEKKSGPPN